LKVISILLRPPICLRLGELVELLGNILSPESLMLTILERLVVLTSGTVRRLMVGPSEALRVSFPFLPAGSRHTSLVRLARLLRLLSSKSFR